MVRIEDASVTQFDNFLDTPIGRPVQVALVLAEFDKESVVDVALHLLSVEEMIIDSVRFARFRQPRSICVKCQTKVEPECRRDYFSTAKCWSSHMELLCGICRDRGR
jgi:hypothetical protein